MPVSSALPQGSVLGPLLFLIYINDLPVNVKSKVRLFADDTALYLTISTSSQSEILQKDLDNLGRWSHKWDMEFNPSKRPSRYYHPLYYRLITATTDYYTFSFFRRAVFHWNNLPLETVEQINQAVYKIDQVSP